MKDVYFNLILHSLKCPRHLNTCEVDGYDQPFQPFDLPTLDIHITSFYILSIKHNLNVMTIKISFVSPAFIKICQSSNR